MLKISIRTIPHDQQNYDTVGNYFMGPDGWLMITVSDLGDWKKEMAVAIHELEEYTSAIGRGITIEEIDKWDMSYEGEGEPGDDSRAPYHPDHVFAEGIEKQSIEHWGMDWEEYGNVLSGLQ